MDILFLRSQPICYGIVDSIANNFEKALRSQGANVICFDLKTSSPQELSHFIDQKFDAVIDFYSGLLSVTLGGENFWDVLGAPVYQACLDYPIYVLDKMTTPIKNHYVLCMDRYYADVIKDRLPHVSGCYHFPVTGVEGKNSKPYMERKNDVIFVGTYTDYREGLASLSQYEEGVRNLIMTFFLNMQKDPSVNQTVALERALISMNINISRNEMFQWMEAIGGIAISAMAYHREKVIGTLVENGIDVIVTGDTWKKAPYADNSHLIIHPPVTEDEYIDLVGDSKISIGLLYCNKAAFSERPGYAMLNGSVCASDTNDYLENIFTDGKDILLYNLMELEKLPERIRQLLDDPQKAMAIADRAYKKAISEHTWANRADMFMDIVNGDKSQLIWQR